MYKLQGGITADSFIELLNESRNNKDIEVYVTVLLASTWYTRPKVLDLLLKRGKVEGIKGTYWYFKHGHLAFTHDGDDVVVGGKIAKIPSIDLLEKYLKMWGDYRFLEIRRVTLACRGKAYYCDFEYNA
ncbi:hypothetical protein D3C81_11740 [compost metagenome]